MSAIILKQEQGQCLIVTNRENDVFNLIGAGMPNQEMGETLFISIETIKIHTRKIREKINQFEKATKQPNESEVFITKDKEITSYYGAVRQGIRWRDYKASILRAVTSGASMAMLVFCLLGNQVKFHNNDCTRSSNRIVRMFNAKRGRETA